MTEAESTSSLMTEIGRLIKAHLYDRMAEAEKSILSGQKRVSRQTEAGTERCMGKLSCRIIGNLMF